MKMVPYDIEKLHYRRTKNLKLFEEFMNGDADCVQLVDHGHDSARYAQSCLRTSALRFGYGNSIKIVVREGNVFLIKVK